MISPHDFQQKYQDKHSVRVGPRHKMMLRRDNRWQHLKPFRQAQDNHGRPEFSFSGTCSASRAKMSNHGRNLNGYIVFWLVSQLSRLMTRIVDLQRVNEHVIRYVTQENYTLTWACMPDCRHRHSSFCQRSEAAFEIGSGLLLRSLALSWLMLSGAMHVSLLRNLTSNI